jgi:CRP/FNR family transcriptional regulator, cyclic AMP receptor protein
MCGPPALPYTWVVLYFDLLQGLDTDDRRTLLAACQPRRFGRREVVFHVGDPGDHLHLVVSGRFAVRVPTADGNMVTLGLVGPGGTFGELVLLDAGRRRSATVVALEPGGTLALGSAQFGMLRRQHPQLDRVLNELLAASVRRLTDLGAEALYLPVDRRLARRLVTLADQYDGAIPLTQEDLADLAGTTRATANGVLRRFAGRGMLRLARGRIVVEDVQALTALAR